MKEVWFWQLILSPHMVKVAKELSKLNIKVHYVIQQELDEERKKLGWTSDSLDDVELHFYQNNFYEIITESHKNAIHILQGLRGNGYVGNLKKKFKENNIDFWVVMETVNTNGIDRYLRDLMYKIIYFKYKNNIKGFLSIGYKSPDWLKSIGVEKYKIFPFTYFLNSSITNSLLHDKFIFIFVGNLIERKRPRLMLESLSKLKKKFDFELWIVGDGVLSDELKILGNNLNLNIKWLGVQPINKVTQFIANADCLILPSLHDGWGAVASEALIEGTPVVCSSSCGVAGVVYQSNYGGVFQYNDENQFVNLLEKQLMRGKVETNDRVILKDWGKCLTAEVGAKYLYDILFNNVNANFLAPWFYEK